MVHVSTISLLTASLALLNPARAVLQPFYAIVKAPYYSAVEPHNIFITIPYLIVSRITKPNTETGRPTKYFFLKSLSDIDQQTLKESKFWYDTTSRGVYSQTAVDAQDSSDDSSVSLGEDLLNTGGVGSGLAHGASSLNLADLEGGDAEANLAAMNPQPDPDTELWELFGTKTQPAGALKAADLDVTSLNNIIAQAYTGNTKLQGKLVDPEVTPEEPSQLWLWRCVFGLDPGIPLGPSIKSQFPTMNAAAAAQFLEGIHQVLIVKPKYVNPLAQTPSNWNPLVYDGMNCFRVEPWQNVQAVTATEFENNLEGIKAGTYNYNARSIQIVNAGELFPELIESSDEGGDGGMGGGDGGGSPEDWTQKIQMPNKPSNFGSPDSKYSKSP